MIEDGSTLQMGIGSIPDAVLASLGNHKDLGVHTEMFSDGVIPLMKSGVINNKFKKKHPYALVSGFMIGSKALYDFVDDNPSIRMLGLVAKWTSFEGLHFLKEGNLLLLCLLLQVKGKVKLHRF